VLGGGWSSPRACGGGSVVRVTSIGIFVLSGGCVTARGWQRLGGIAIKAIGIRRASGVNGVGVSPRDWCNDSWSTTSSSGRIEGVGMSSVVGGGCMNVNSVGFSGLSGD
jgi:hypothetical protein